MARERRRRRRRRGTSSRPSGFTERIGSVVPDQIENPLKAVVGAPLGLTANLAHDVKNAVVGLPMGLITTVQHPVRSVENIGKSYWQTYSPFFTGDPLKGLQNLYDHPLAPILDVATVFTLGAAGAARTGAALSKAGRGGATAKSLAGLREAKTVPRLHPDNPFEMPLTKTLSRSPGRRIIQEGLLKYESAMPDWYLKAGYQRAKLGEMARRSTTARYIEGQAALRNREIEQAVKAGDRDYFATRFQMESIIKGGEALEDITELGKRARTTVYAHMHSNLMRHNAKNAYDLETAKAYLAENPHLTLIKAPEYLDGKYWSQLDRVERKHAKAARKRSDWQTRKYEPGVQYWERVRQENAELANSIPKIEDELARAGNELQTLYAEGHRVANRTAQDNPTTRQLMTNETRVLDDATARVKSLEELREKSLKAREKHEEALGKLEDFRRQKEEMDFEVARLDGELGDLRERSSQDFYASVGQDYDSFRKSVDNFGHHTTTKDFARAAKTPDGNYYIVPKHDAYNLAFEGGNSLRFIHKVLHKPTMIWKSAVIGWTPRTITNNAIGNWFLYAARELPSANGVMAVSDALRFRFGSKIAGEALFPENHWLHRFFSDELADQFGVGNELVRFGDTSRLRRARVGPFYAIQHSVAERPLRIATLYKALRDMPEVKEMVARYNAKGIRGSKAVDRAIERVMRQRPDLRDEAAQSSRRLAGDYLTMSEGEKFVRDIVPFYLWNRHILKTTGNMFAEQPVRLALMSQLSELGIEETENMLGEIPEFLRGAIPLAALGLGDRTGRNSVMLTASLNPFATIGELAESADAFITGSGRRGAAVAQLNPFLVGGFESVFEQNALTGSPSPREGGVIPDVLRHVIDNLPQLKLANELSLPDADTTPAGNEYLYSRDNRSPLTSFLGIPMRSVSEEAAARLKEKADEESTSSRRRRRRRRR